MVLTDALVLALTWAKVRSIELVVTRVGSKIGLSTLIMRYGDVSSNSTCDLVHLHTSPTGMGYFAYVSHGLKMDSPADYCNRAHPMLNIFILITLFTVNIFRVALRRDH